MRYVFDQYDIAGVICIEKGKDLEIVFLSVMRTIITWCSIEKNVSLIFARDINKS